MSNQQVSVARVLDVRDLHVDFRTAGGTLTAVRGISFAVAAGETLAVVGESGSGKSVSAQAILRLLPGSASVRGRALFQDRDLLTLSARDLRHIRGRELAMVFQDVASSLNPVRRIGRQLTEPLRLHLGLDRRAARDRALELLAAVGLPSPGQQLHAYPHELSGGMRQRVMIAIAIACRPRVLLVDEATTALDVSIQAQILELLRSLAAESNLAMVVISHDMSVVAGIADRVAVMYAGEMMEIGSVDQVFYRPQHPYTVGLLRSIPSLDARSQERLPSIEGALPDPHHPLAGCPFAPRCPLVMAVCRTERPPLAPKPAGQHAACFADLSRDLPAFEISRTQRQPRAAGSETLLTADDLAVHFKVGGVPLLRSGAVVHAVDGISFSVRKGETLALVGESGSGKSTVARAAIHLVKPTRGHVTFEGNELAALRPAALRRLRVRFQLVAQEADGSLNPHRRVGNEIAEPLIVHDLARGSAVRRRVAELLDLVGLPADVARRYPFELSGGQQQRVNLARALAPNPSLVIADEPTSALDVSVRAQIINLLEDLKDERNLTYLVISHDLSVVRHMSDRIAVMYLGQIVEIGDCETVFNDPRHPYTRALVAVIPRPDPRIERSQRRVPIPGEIPSPLHPPGGCPFHTRCPLAFDRCHLETPPSVDVGGGHLAACFLADSLSSQPAPALQKES